MATYTPNNNLKKPAGIDYVLVSDFNSNSDKLDAVLGNKANLTTTDKTNLVLAINEVNANASHPPYIGEDNHWYVWNALLSEYEDSGIDAGSAYCHIKWSATEPDDDTDMKETPNAYIGIYTGPNATAPTAYTAYTWYRYKGETGNQGEPGTGNNWYVGTAITGTSDTPTAYATGIANALVGDIYMNSGALPNTGRVYVCSLGGDAPMALWVYSHSLYGSGEAMLASEYAEGPGVVKDSAKFGGQLPSYYAVATDVPSAAFINVKDYGAFGDGITDDAAAIQAIVDNATDYTILMFPSGDYIMGTTLVLKENTPIIGVGNTSRIKAADNAELLELILLPERHDRQNYSFSIRDILIDGNKANSGVTGYALHINNCWKATLENVVVIYSGGSGIVWEGNEDVGTSTCYMVNCHVYGCDGYGVYFDGFCGDMHVYGGDFGYNYYENISFGCYGSSVEAATIWGCRNSDGISISNVGAHINACRIEGSFKNGVTIGASFATISNNKIYSNSMEGNRLWNGIEILASSMMEGIDIVGNRISSSFSSGNGVHLHAIKFQNDYQHRYCSVLGNSMLLSGNGTIDNTNDIVANLAKSDVADYSWIGTNVLATLSVNQSISAATVTKLLFDTKAFDGFDDFNISNSTFTVKQSGMYTFDLTVFLSNAETENSATLYIDINNGTLVYVLDDMANNEAFITLKNSITLYCYKGWEIFFKVYSAAAITATGGATASRLGIKLSR